MDIYERLDDMDADLAATKAAFILHGLGFTKTMQMKKCKDFSGTFLARPLSGLSNYPRFQEGGE